ncbi:MAG: chorismate-binding protein [Deltaproteobacteria bacterium]|nr:chorismate-binding protein [Deltaproteobacteria bacterium]
MEPAAAQTLASRTWDVAWVDRDAGSAWTGRGVGAEVNSGSPADGPELVADIHAGRRGGGTWLGGIAFPGARWTPLWAGFPAVRFVRPSRAWQGALPVAGGPRAVGGAPDEQPDPAWLDAVTRARGCIRSGGMEKVVLARAIARRAATAWDAHEVFDGFLRHVGGRRVFLLRGTDGAALVGATPETLLRIRGDRVEVDALAGSQVEGSAFTVKDRHEHRVVVDAITAVLDAFARRVHRPGAPRVMDLGYIRHLHTRLSATLAPDASVADLLRALFPTPAVAGAPREAALAFIRQHETIDRGWYAGAIGRVAPGDVDLAVALRCVLLRGAEAQVFVGAGIMDASEPGAEWAETARKSAPAMRALEGAAHAVPG